MRARWISLSVVALSTLGLGGVTADRARAYVVRNPEGAYASLAFKLAVELEARRTQDQAGADMRKLLVKDLVYRPAQPAKVRLASYDADAGEVTFQGLRRNWRSRPNDPASVAPQAREAVQYLQIRSKQFSSTIKRCPRPPPTSDYFECIYQALDDYADWVEQMPPTPASVAPVAAPALREAARKVRSAKNLAEARAAVTEAISTIGKSIELVQAGGEDTVRRLELSQRSVIINSMEQLDTELVQAVGL